MRSADWNLIAIMAALCIVAWAITDYGKSKNEVQARHDHYCDMVLIYAESSGDFGWPNYDNRECN